MSHALIFRAQRAKFAEPGTLPARVLVPCEFFWHGTDRQIVASSAATEWAVLVRAAVCTTRRTTRQAQSRAGR